MVPGRAHPGSGLPPDSLRRGLRSRSGWADPLGLGLSCPSGPAPPTPVRARQYTGHPPASSLALVPTPRAPYPPSARAASHPVGTTRVGARAAPLPVASFSSISESCSPDPSRVGAREFVGPPPPPSPLQHPGDRVLASSQSHRWASCLVGRTRWKCGFPCLRQGLGGLWGLINCCYLQCLLLRAAGVWPLCRHCCGSGHGKAPWDPKIHGKRLVPGSAETWNKLGTGHGSDRQAPALISCACLLLCEGFRGANPQSLIKRSL